MSSSSSSADVMNHGDSKPPMFPEDRERFEEWKAKMESYLAARDLITVILKPSDTVTHKTKLPNGDYAAWLDKCNGICEQADTVWQAASNTKERTAAWADKSVIFKRELGKCRKVWIF